MLLPQFFDTASADPFTFELQKVFALAAQDAGGSIFFQQDRIGVHKDLDRITPLYVQRLSELDRKDDAAKLVHFSYDTGCFHGRDLLCC